MSHEKLNHSSNEETICVINKDAQGVCYENKNKLRTLVDVSLFHVSYTDACIMVSALLFVSKNAHLST